MKTSGAIQAVGTAWAILLIGAAASSGAKTNETLTLSPPPDLHGALAEPAFEVVQSETWPAGLVPLFLVEHGKRFELRRLPSPGAENFSEPAFFALPPEDEPRAGDIAGHWICSATNTQGSRHEPHWELAVDGTRLAGRFSQHGEYRVAAMTGGLFRSNQFEMQVEWVNDRYTITGIWRGGALTGTWRQQGESEQGAWSATRAVAVLKVPAADRLVALYEWRRGDERRYSVAQRFHETGWQRAARPLCRVWRVP